MWKWFSPRTSGHRRPAPARLYERLEDRLLFDAAPAPAPAPDAPVDDPMATAVQAAPAVENAAVDLAQQVEAPARTEIVFVDKRVGNYETLVAEVLQDATAEVHFLDRNADGLAQIAAALEGRTDVDALHIISHGDQGQLLLGTTVLTQQSMQQVYAETLQAIGGALAADGDILVYGCEFAKGTAGIAAAQTLSHLTGADVAASTNDTGHENLQADWILELRIGSVESNVIVSDGRQQLFGGVLAEPIAAFLISDATDQVIKLTDRTNTSTAVVVGPMTNTFNVEALVRDTTTGNIYASDANRLGIVNLESGTVTVVGNYGTIGTNALNTVLALTVHPDTGEIWAVDTNGGGAVDYLFKVNKATGAYVPNAFGSGVHHLALDTNGAGVGDEVDDIAWGRDPSNPTQWVLYASMSSRLISINTTTGAVTNIGLFGTNITDMEGLSADENGNLWGTTGNSSGLINRVWTVNKTTGAATEVGQVPIGGDYEGIVFLTQPVDLETDITVTQSTPDEGETITYVIKVTNTDPSILSSGVQLRSLVPSGLTFLSSTATKGSYDNSTGVWNIGVMNAGTTQTLQIAYRVNSGTAGQTINRIAEIFRADNPDPDSDPNNGIVGEDDQDTVSLTVASYPNNPPVAVNNTYTTAFNTALTVNGTTLPSLLANDSDPNGDTLTVNTTAVTGPANGTLTLNADGTFLYTPNSGYSGTDTFVYQISDGRGGTAQATVSIEVTPIPIGANNDAYTTPYNQSLTVNATGILGNDVYTLTSPTAGATYFWSAPADTNANTTWEDSATAGDELDWALAGGVARTTTPTTSLPTITAAYNFTGGSGTADDFEAQSGDPTNNSATFEFWINPAGTSNADVDLIFETGGNNDGVSFVLNAGTLEFHVADQNGSAYTATATANVAALITANEFFQVTGVVDLESNQLRLYINGSLVSTANATGDIADWGDNRNSGLGAVNNSVKSFTASPTAYEGEIAFGRIYESKLNNAEVLANYRSIAGGVTVTQVNGSAPAIGTQITLPSGALLTQQANGSFVYNPNGQFNSLPAHATATDSYTYTITDALGNTDTAVVTITITGPNAIPVAVNNTYRVDPNTTLEAATILGNDSDADGDTLTVNTVPVTNVTNGILTLHADGTFVYTPFPGYTGSDSFVYQISDGYGGTATATVYINVAPNTAPTTANSTVTAIEDATYTFSAANFPYSDMDADAFHSVRITSLPAAGSLRYNGVAITAAQITAGFDVAAANIGLLTFVPTANQNGSNYASFDFRVSDGIDRSTAATMTIDVTAVNDAPTVTVPGAQTATAGVGKVISGVSFGDIDAGAANVTVTLAIPAGTLTLNTGVSGGLVAGEITNNGTGTVTITSTIAKINATLANATGLTWLYNTSGTQTLTIGINDLGNTGVDPSTVGQPATGTSTNEQASATVAITIPAPTLSINNVTVVEGTDAYAVFTVSLSNPTTMAIGMNLSLTAGTATGGGTDYGASGATNLQVWNGSTWVNATTATIPSGQTSVQVRTPITDDFVSDNGETFTLGATVTSGTTSNSSASGTGTINDEAAGTGDITYVSIAGPTTVAEGATTTNYTVSLTQPAVTDVTVTLTYTGTAANGTDYTGQATVTILAGTSSRTFALPTAGDNLYEGDEPYTVTITGTSGGGLERLLIDSAANAVTTAIVDDDTPTLSIANVTVTEGTDAHALFTLTLSNPSTQNVAVALSLANGTATVGTDTGTSAALQFYNGSTWVTVPVSGQVTIPANSTSLQVRTAINDDAVAEVTETFTLTAAHVSGTLTSTANVVATGTILDTDAAQITINDVTQNEGNSGTTTYTFTVTMDRAVDTAVSVNWATAHVTTNATDFTAQSGTVTFAAGEQSKTISVTVNGDQTVELNETFNVNLSGLSAAGRSVSVTDTQGISTVTNDDAAAITINDVSQAEDNSGTTTYTFTVSMDRAVDAAVSVNWATANNTTNSTDLAAQSGSVTFAAGETSKTFSVTVSGDQTVELNETFNVDLSGLSAGGRNVSITDAQGVGTLVNDDAAAITINDVTQSEGNSGSTTYTFTVSMDRAVDTAVSVNWATAHDTTNATDLAAQSGSVTFAAGELTKTFSVTVSGDQTVELNETFNVNLSGLSAGGRNVSITDAQGVGTITNDDAAALTINDVSQSEGNSGSTTYTFTVSLDRAVDAAVSVDWATANGTTNGTDLAAQTGSVTFAAGETSKTFSVTVSGDQTVELNETFNVNLSNLSNGGRNVTVTDSQGVGTLVNDDTAALTINDITQTEGNSGSTSYTFTLTLDRAVDAAVSIDWATANGTTNATDLAAQSGSVTFAAGEVSKTITVTTSGDQTVELSETFNVNLSNLSNGGRSITIGDAQGVGTLTNDDTAALTINDVTQAEGDSGSTTYTFTVSLDRAVDTALSVNWATAHVTTNASDLGTQSGSVTFAAGELTKTFSVTVSGDQTVELSEAFNVNLSNLQAGGNAVAIGDAQGVGTITNDDAAALTINDVTQAEGDSGSTIYTFTVSLDRAVDAAVSVNWATANVTTNGTDLAAQSGTVTFAAGETSKTITITTARDTTVELNETFAVNLSGLAASGRDVTIGDAQGVGTLVNDDAATVAINDVSQAEGDSGTTTFTFTVALNRAVDTAVSVNWATTHVATDATDLAAQSGTVTFAAGETVKTFTVTVSGDQAVELDEGFYVDLSGLSAGGRSVTFSDAQSIGTILNDDAAAITINDVTQAEGDSGSTTYTFTVSLDHAVDAAVSVDWSTANITTNGTDLAAQSGTVTFAAGETSKTFTVTVAGDQTVELNETFHVNLSNLSAGGRDVTISDAQGVGTITNDDAAAITIDDVSHSEGDSGNTTYTFTVSLDRAVDSAVSVNWATANGTTNSTDLAAQSGTVTFAAGETSKTFTVTVTRDTTVELDETFAVNLSGLAAAGRSVSINDAQGVGTIVNDDSAAVTIDDVTETEGDSGTVTYTFTVSLDQPVDAAVSVNWATANGTTNGADLSAQSGTVMFAAGEQTKTFTVTVSGDTTVELNETFNVNLSGVSAGGRDVTMGDAQGTGTIIDDDGAQVSISDASRVEGDSGTTTYTFTISLDQTAPTDVSVDWATAHNTTNGSDLAGQSGTVTFLAGETTKTISVTVNRDQTVELDETFFVNLSNLSTGGSAVVIGDNQGVGTIVNDDAAALTINDVTQVEGDSGMTTYTFTASLDRAVDSAVSVNWATAHGTTNATDLTAQSGTVTFAAGETSKTFTVTVNRDTTVELDETFAVNLSGLNASGRDVTISDAQGVGTLTNDDAAAITIDDVSLAEGDSGSTTYTFTVTLDQPVDAAVSVSWATANVTTNGTDLTAQSGSVTFAAGETSQTFKVTVSGDQTVELNETFHVNLSGLNAGGRDVTVTDAQGVGTITNDDAAQMTINDVTLTEGDSGTTTYTFTVSLDRAVDTAVSVNWATANGTTNSTDLAAQSGSVTFAVGETTKTFSVTVSRDETVELDETFNVNLSGLSAGGRSVSITDAQGVGTITNDDAAQVTINDVSQSEGDSGITTYTFTVSLDQPVDAAVSINWATANGTTNGADLTAQSGAITFAAGETSKTFSVTVSGDQTVELDETFQVNLSGPSASGRDVTIADAQGEGTLVNDDAAEVSVNNVTSVEGNSGTTTYTFTVLLDRAVDAAVSVDWATANVTTNGTDLTSQSGTVTFAAGETSKTFSVTVSGDQTVELDETFHVNLSGLTANGRDVTISDAQGVGTILNNDTAAITIDDVTQAEGNSGTTAYTFTVSLSHAVDTAVSVNWATANTTTNGTDLPAQSGTVTFAAGETTKTFTVNVSGDQTVELTETFAVNLSGLSAGGRSVSITDSQGVGTLTNDDAAAITIDDVTHVEGDSGTTTYTFTVTLDQPVDTAVSVNWATANVTTNVTDLAAQSGSVTFGAGETTKTFSVTVSGDQTVELDETFTVNLSGLSAGGRSVTISDAQGVGTITNDDAAALTINNVTQNEGNSGTTSYTFTLSLDRAVDTAVSVDWATANVTTNVTDLAAQSGTVTFAAGETSKTITITTSRDQTVELDETFTVNLSGLSAGSRDVTLDDAQGVGTLVNDDAARMTIDNLTFTEGNSGTLSYTFTVALDQAVDAAVSVDWATAHVTTDSTDLAAQSGTVTFAAGETTKTFSVTVSRDQTVELNETFHVDLSNLATNGRDVTITDSQGVGTITNDDSATLTIDDVTQAEGNSGTTAYTFTVSLSHAVDTAVSVNWATANGTTNGTDLAAQSGTVTFAAGETTKTFTVNVSGDQTVELNETFEVDLSGLSAGGRSVSITDAQGVGTLTNDDAATVSVNSVPHTEGDSGTTPYVFTVTLSHAADVPVSVNWATSNYNTDSSDLAAQSGTVTFSAGETSKTFTVNVNGDLVVENDETFEVNLSGLSAAGRNFSIGSATGYGTIIDNDAAELSIDNVTHMEGNTGTTTYTFTISLDRVVSEDLLLSWETIGLDTNTTDLADQLGMVTIAAGQTSATFDVLVNGDQTVEADETFFVSFMIVDAQGQAVTTNDSIGDGTIENDDAATLTINDVSQSEGQSGTTTYTFTASLDRAVDRAVSIDWATAFGTTDVSDLAAQSGTMTFAAGETTKTFTVTVNGDRLVEGDETFFVNLSGLSASGRSVTLGDAQGQGTLVNDDNAPTTLTNTLTTTEDTDLALSAIDFAYSDADSDPMVSITVLSLPTDGSLLYLGNVVTQTDIDNGLVIVVADIDDLVFRPDPNESGVLYAQFSFSVSDGVNSSTPALMRFHVLPVNDPPVARNNQYTLLEDGSRSGNVITDNTGAGVDSDIDGGALFVVDVDGNSLNGITPVSGPANGTLVLNSDGTFTYTPNANYNGGDSFTYRISDGNGGFSDAVVTLIVTPVNDVPTATNNTAAVTEDGPTADSGNLLTDNDGFGVDADIDLDPLTVKQVQFGATTVTVPGAGTTNIAGLYGTLTIAANGSYTYTLNNALAAVQQLQVGESLMEVFNYTNTDGTADAVAALTVTINGRNDDPAGVGTIPNQANVDAATVPTLDVSGFFDDADLTDSLTFDALGTLPPGLSIHPTTGHITGTLTPSASQGGVGGVYTVTVQVTDDYSRTATQTFNWTVTNPVPTATDNTGSVTEDGPLTDSGNLLTDNDGAGIDSDPDGDALLVTRVDGVLVPAVGSVVITGQYGTLTIAANGTYTYTLTNTLPTVQALGVGETLTESFDYTLSDGEGGTDTAGLTITIRGTNDVPTTVGTLPDQSDVDGEPIAPVNVSGVFGDMDTNDSLTFTAGGTLPPGLTLDPQTGSITGTLTPSASQGGVGGVYAVTITATDEHGTTTTVTFDWTVTNPAPTATNNRGTVREDGPHSDTGNVLTHDDGVGTDSDPDGDALSVSLMNGVTVPAGGSIVLQGQYGRLTISSSGTYTYALTSTLPAVQALRAGQSLTDTFNYTLSDGEGGSDGALLLITIEGDNDPPVANNDRGATRTNSVARGNVLPNDRDPDGNPLTVTALNGSSAAVGQPIRLPSGAILTLHADGTYTYDPNGRFDDLAAGQPGLDSFDYTISDGRGGTSTAKVVITITGVNAPPDPGNDMRHTPLDTPVTVQVLDNDTDPNGDPLSVILLAQSPDGQATVNADGTITFTPNEGFTGMAYIRYLAEDPHGASNPATVVIMVDQPAEQFIFRFDSFNNFSQPRQIFNPHGFGTYRQPLLTQEIFTLSPEPIFSGYARPGTTVVGRVYDERGVLVGEQFAHSDPGGNWLMQFQGLAKLDRYRIEFDYVVESQDIYGYMGLDPSDNSYQAMQPLTNGDEPFGVPFVLRQSPFESLESLHQQLNRPLGLGD